MGIFDSKEVEAKVSFSVSPLDVKFELDELRDSGQKRGSWLGFDSLDKLWSMKRGSTTYLLAAPHAGKSSFINEIVCNLIEFSHYKVIIWSPETGSPKDIFNELLWSINRKRFIKNKAGEYATDKQAARAIATLDSHVKVLDFGRRDVSLKMLYDQVERLKEDDFDADLLIVDPFTEIVDDDNLGLRADIALGRKLSGIARNSSAMDIHTLIAVHTNNIPPQMGDFRDGTKKAYIPAPLPSQIAGGQAWFRRAYMIVSLWIPPVGLKLGEEEDPDTGDKRIVYAEKLQTIVEVLKAKPKIVGSLGKCMLTYNMLENRYRELDGTPSYECPNGLEEREVSPNYDESKISNQSEIPF